MNLYMMVDIILSDAILIFYSDNYDDRNFINSIAFIE